MEKTTLRLELPSDPRWVNIAEKNIQNILVDHAFCEQKEASSCTVDYTHLPLPTNREV